MADSLDRNRSRLPDLLAVLLLVLLPAALLGDSLFGGRKYLPFDTAEFPPTATMLSQEQLAGLQAGSNYDANEPPVWFVPELQLVKEALGQGVYPHWNPYVRGGAPLAAHGHLGLLNPLHWPALLFDDPADGLLYLTTLMFALAGLLMYGLLRSLTLEPAAALFGAVAFALSGTLAANGHWYMRMEPIVLLPGMLWAALAMARHPGRVRVLCTVALSVCIGLAWTAGFPPFCIPVSLLLGAFAVALVLREWTTGGARAAGSLLGALVIAAGLGLGLAAAQVMQQLEFFPVSNRPPAPDLASVSRFAFDPMGLLGYVLPDAFLHPGDRTLPSGRAPLTYLLFSRREWGTGAPLLPNYNFTEYAVFPGTLTLVLALVGLLHRGPRFRLWCAGALAVLFALAIGIGPGRSVFALPVIQTVPPYRFLGPACVFVAMLAAVGLQTLRHGAAPRLLRAVASVCLAGAAACIVFLPAEPAATRADDPWLQTIAQHYEPLAPGQVTPDFVLQQYMTGPAGEDYVQIGRLRLRWNLIRGAMALGLGGVLLVLLSLRGRQPLPLWGCTVIVLLTGAELAAFGAPLNRGKELPHPDDSPVHAFLREQQQVHRESGGIMVARAHSAGEVWMLAPGTLAKDHIRDLHFYTFVDGRSSEPFRRLYGPEFMLRDYLPGPLPDDQRLRIPFFDMMGIRFLLSTERLQHGGVQVGPELHGANGSFYVFERISALPRAYTVPRLEVLPDDEAVLQAALSPDLDPRKAALVTRGEAEHLRDPVPGTAAPRAVRFHAEDGKSVQLDVEAGEACYLVLADTHLPGWRAWIDGIETPIARGNVYQRVLRLPPDACRVAFSYFTPGLRAGAALTAVAFSLCCALALWALLRRSVSPPGAAWRAST